MSEASCIFEYDNFLVVDLIFMKFQMCSFDEFCVSKVANGLKLTPPPQRNIYVCGAALTELKCDQILLAVVKSTIWPHLSTKVFISLLSFGFCLFFNSEILSNRPSIYYVIDSPLCLSAALYRELRCLTQ